MNRKIVIALGAVLIAVAAYFLFVPMNEVNKSTFAATPKKYVAAEGKVEALPGMEVEVGTGLTARIEKMFVKENDAVKKGQLIAQLESKDIQARLDEAKSEWVVARAKLSEVASGSRKEEIQMAAATLDRATSEMMLARKEYERRKDLYQKSMISAASLDEGDSVFKVALARVKEADEAKRLLEKGPKRETITFYEDSVKSAAASVDYYQKLLDKTFITAPISGKVIRRYLDEGEAVRPELALVAIADVEHVRINAEIDETDVGRFRLGDPVEVTSSAYPGEVFTGKVQEIADYVGARNIKPDNPAVNLGLKVVQVKIELQQKTPLKLGMSVDVRITPKEK